MRDWIETWQLEVHLVNLTAAWGAINVAGPACARPALRGSATSSFDGESFPYLRHRELTVAGVPCRAIRLGLRRRALVRAPPPVLRRASGSGTPCSRPANDLGIRPHGLEALRLLRLEKGHVIVGQDTDFDSTPAKLNMSWAVKLDKPTFVGRAALERLAAVRARAQAGGAHASRATRRPRARR